MLSAVNEWLFNPNGLTPHGFCLLWQPWMIWLHALGNAGVGLAYIGIPIELVVLLRKRRDVMFRPVFWLFAAFIFLCGATHWLDLLTLWVPAYGLEAVVMAATAAVSLTTWYMLNRLRPAIASLPSPTQMEAANKALQTSEALWREMFIRAPGAIHFLDEHGTVVAVSNRWLELFGYKREEVVGRPLTDFSAPEGDGFFRDNWPNFLIRGRLDDARTVMAKRDGAPVPVTISARIFNGPEGTFARSMAIVTPSGPRKAHA